jgi:ABC-2 type transport system permease protein
MQSVVDAKPLEADGTGHETVVPLHTWLDVALFANAKQPFESQKPLYLQKHLLVSGINTITVNVSEKPAYAIVDPYEKMADRQRDNNGQLVGGR